MAANPNAYGPLVDGPDYSFIDGRPTPPGSGKVKRAVEQREIAVSFMPLNRVVL
jgi:large subunit ribosomal protein L52